MAATEERPAAPDVWKLVLDLLMVKVCKLGGGEEQVKCGGGCIDVVFLLQVPAVVYGSRSSGLEEF